MTQPAGGFSELSKNISSQENNSNSKVQAIIFLNCGANIDFSSQLWINDENHKNLRIFIFDIHLPI